MENNTPHETFYLGVNSLYAVVGYNYENADMDNPRGEIVREVFHLTAVNDFGDRWTWGSFRTFEAAEAAIPNAPPVMFWDDSYPVYGSPAYEAYGMEDEIAWEKRNEETWK